jgi:hypothetical protein
MELAQKYPPTPAGLDQLIRENPELGITKVSSGDIQLPDGTIIDVLIAADIGGGKGWQWLLPGQGGQASSPAPAPTLGSWSSGMASAGLTSFQEQVRQMILQQLAGASQPVNPNDPNIRLPIDEAERRAEEVRRRRQSAMAERLTQKGIGDSGAMDTEVRQGFEDMSQTISGVTAEIIGREMTRKRQELVSLLTTAMASGDAESARAVQMQLAMIDKQLREMGLSQQQGQFDDQMDLNWAQFQSGLL